MPEPILNALRNYWSAVIEIAIMSVVIYFGYLYFRGTRGAKVLTGLALLFFGLSVVSGMLDLQVISWLLERFTVFLAIALVIIFQPELRRVLAELGSHHIFSTTGQKRETIELLTQVIFELSHRQFGSLIAIERDTAMNVYAESGTNLDSEFSPELIITIFQPKTPLHDGGVILRNDRVVAAGCIFPVSQRENLDRNLGLRHRAALGVSEESDAIVLVVSEETGQISICHAGSIERGFTPETFRRRLNQLLLLEKYEKNDPEQLEGEDRVSSSGGSDMVRN